MSNKSYINALVVFYFLNLFFYSMCSLFRLEEYEKIFWFLRVPILITLYFVSSKKRNYLYFVALVFYQLASIFFTMETEETFFYGSISSLFFKIFLFLLVYKFITKQNRKAIAIAFVPFFIIYLYLIEIILFSLGNNLYLWLLNALVTSIIGGIAIINYLNESNPRNYWLLLSSILFIVQIGAYFMNKFYVEEEATRQMVILSYAFSHFTFYKFLILNEE